MQPLQIRRVFCGHGDVKECEADQWDRAAIVLGAIFVVFLALDVFTTVLALGQGYEEANPFMVPIVSNLPVFVLFKSIEAGIFIGLARILNTLAPGGAVWVYGAANIAAIVPVAGNVGMLLV